MAVLMTHRWPGGTEAQYRATIATVHPPDGLPEGQLSRTCRALRRAVPDRCRVGLQGERRQLGQRRAVASMPVEGGFEGQPEERVAGVFNPRDR